MASTSLHGKYSNYHYCIVRECKNTSIRTPGKLWIRLPSDTNMRNTWLKLAKRDPDSLSIETQIYFCEDHFDLENDMENYMQYKIMGSVKRIRMKSQCVPSRFNCQTDRKRKLTTAPDKLQHNSNKTAGMSLSGDNEKQIHPLEMSTSLVHQDAIPSSYSSLEKKSHNKEVQVVQHNTLLHDQAVQPSQEHISCQAVQVQCENMVKSTNLNIVRLKFSAHDTINGEETCEPVFSKPLHNMKRAATNDLKICRISRSCGSASGGEDVFILVEKVNKENIMIRFFEMDDNGERGWTSVGQFMKSDVHHQYAIVFQTPPYKNPETPVNVQVFIELVRPSDGRTSEPKEFKYKANQAYKQIKKRKQGSSFYSIGSSSRGSLKSGCDIPISVANHLRNPIYPNQCDLASALYSGSKVSQSPVSSPMWSSPHSVMLPEAPIQPLQIDSMELEQMQIPQNAPQNSVPDDLRSLLNEYLRSYGESLPEEKNSMEFIRSMLVADSGRANPQKQVTSLFQGDRATNQNKESDLKKPKAEYPAYYKPEDGIEVKKLVKDLCDMIRNKEGFKKAEVRARLERLLEIRLSNGDTFLHMTLCSNLSSLEYIVKIIHSVKATHLLDCANDRQQTTLHLAVLNNKPKMVSLFVAKGSNPMLKDDKDLNVIHYAVEYRSCLDVLLDSIKKNEVSCDLNDYNGEKQSALHMAVVSGWELGTRLLLQHGASFSVRDAAGRTPLHLAAYDDRLAVTKILLEFIPSSEIDVMDDAGNTALQIVCGGTTVRENSGEIARILLEKKAYPYKHEDSNESADLMKAYVTVECMHEDDIKSEPEDEYESADEGISQYGRKVSMLVDVAGAWRELAQRLRLDALQEWYGAQPSPTLTMVEHHLKESRDDSTSKSLAMILENIGQTEAASVIRKHISRRTDRIRI